MKHKKFNEIFAYTYYIKRKLDGLQYHGVRFHNIKTNRSTEEDFGIFYFTSGKFKNEFKQNPRNFDWKLMWTFDTVDESLLYETKINEKLYKRKQTQSRTYGLRNKGRKLLDNSNVSVYL